MLTGKTSGEVLFNGEDIFQANRARQKELRREMQMIFQDPFSVAEPPDDGVLSSLRSR